MKLGKFNELCEQKWADGRGDVAELFLTEKSYDELYEDILVNRTGKVSLVYPHWDLVNPVTRCAVKIRTHADGRDLVMVHYGGWKKSEKVDVDE